jgi:hypothetical protein
MLAVGRRFERCLLRVFRYFASGTCRAGRATLLEHRMVKVTTFKDMVSSHLDRSMDLPVSMSTTDCLSCLKVR